MSGPRNSAVSALVLSLAMGAGCAAGAPPRRPPATAHETPCPAPELTAAVHSDPLEPAPTAFDHAKVDALRDDGVESGAIEWSTVPHDLLEAKLVARADGGVWLVPRRTIKGSKILFVKGAAPHGRTVPAWTAQTNASLVAAPDGASGLWVVASAQREKGREWGRLIHLGPGGDRLLDVSIAKGLGVRALAAGPGGGLVLAGTVYGSTTLGGSTIEARLGGRVEWVGMLDAKGKPAWIETLEDILPNSIQTIAADAQGTVALCAELREHAGQARLPALLALGEGGDRLWTKPLRRQTPSYFFGYDGVGPFAIEGGFGLAGSLADSSHGGPETATDLGAGPLFGDGRWAAKLDASSNVVWTHALPDASEVSFGADGAVATADVSETPMPVKLVSRAGSLELSLTAKTPEACQHAQREASIAVATDRLYVLVSCRTIDNDFYGTTSGPTTTVIASHPR